MREVIVPFDVRHEPEAIRAQYGATPFANGCLLARRLVERGVRLLTDLKRRGRTDASFALPTCTGKW